MRCFADSAGGCFTIGNRVIAEPDRGKVFSSARSSHSCPRTILRQQEPRVNYQHIRLASLGLVLFGMLGPLPILDGSHVMEKALNRVLGNLSTVSISSQRPAVKT
jgi:hypothetical protein